MPEQEIPSEKAKQIETAASIPADETTITAPTHVAESKQPALTQSPPQNSRQIEENNHKTEAAASIQTSPAVAAVHSPQAAPPSSENCVEETPQKSETISNENTVEKVSTKVIDTEKIEEKMSNLNTNSEAHSSTFSRDFCS